MAQGWLVPMPECSFSSGRNGPALVAFVTPLMLLGFPRTHAPPALDIYKGGYAIRAFLRWTSAKTKTKYKVAGSSVVFRDTPFDQ